MFHFAWLLGPLTCTFPFTPPIHPWPYFAVISCLSSIINFQIPDKVLEHRSRETVQDGESSSPQSRPADDVESDNLIGHDASHNGQNGKPTLRSRRLSTNEDDDGMINPESGKTRSTTSLQ